MKTDPSLFAKNSIQDIQEVVELRCFKIFGLRPSEYTMEIYHKYGPLEISEKPVIIIRKHNEPEPFCYVKREHFDSKNLKKTYENRLELVKKLCTDPICLSLPFNSVIRGDELYYFTKPATGIQLHHLIESAAKQPTSTKEAQLINACSMIGKGVGNIHSKKIKLVTRNFLFDESKIHDELANMVDGCSRENESDGLNIIQHFINNFGLYIDNDRISDIAFTHTDLTPKNFFFDTKSSRVTLIEPHNFSINMKALDFIQFACRVEYFAKVYQLKSSTLNEALTAYNKQYEMTIGTKQMPSKESCDFVTGMTWVSILTFMHFMKNDIRDDGTVRFALNIVREKLKELAHELTM